MQLKHLAIALAAVAFAPAAMADPPSHSAPALPNAAARSGDRVAHAFIQHLLDRIAEDGRVMALQAAQLDVLREDAAAAKKTDQGGAEK